METRRDLMRSALAAGEAGAGLTNSRGAEAAAQTTVGTCRRDAPVWPRGPEGQRIADLGDGTFLNPIVAGDRPDPTILKDGDVYYMTFSSFDAVPGIVIWRSTDLVNWTPLSAALQLPIGTVWALDLVKHQGRYFIYIPVLADEGQKIFVIHADKIEGPWSDPVDLGIPNRIDPGHAVGEDAKRYLFLNGGGRVPLTYDGLATDGGLERAYDLWQYPDDWVVEM